MSTQQVPIVECTYGWGQKATLYYDRLEANGIVYILSDLMYVEPVYLRLIGISSLRLKLFFKHQVIVLRGLTNSEPVQKMIKYLTSIICSPAGSTIGLPAIPWYQTHGSIPQQSFSVSPQNSFWDYNAEETSSLGKDRAIRSRDLEEDHQNELSVFLSPSLYPLEGNTEEYGMTEEYEVTKSIKRVVLADLSTDASASSTGTDLLELYGQLILPEIIYLPEHIEYHTAQYNISPHKSGVGEKSTSSPSSRVVSATLTEAWESAPEKKPLQLQLQRERQRLKRLQSQHEIRVFGFSVEGLVTQLRQGQLPCIDVPLKLLPGEIAHYRTDATLCEEPTEAIGYEETKQYYPIKYRIKDRGSFILTNARILYLGRKRHMFLDYDQLVHISHWHDFMALTVANFQKRQLFEMRRPLECTIYLEYLLRRYMASDKIELEDVSPVSRPPLSIPETSSTIRMRALARMSKQMS